MQKQITLKWSVQEHMTAEAFRKRLRAVGEIEPPKMLFWHSATGKTVGQGYCTSDPKALSKTEEKRLEDKRKPPQNWKRKRGPKSAEDLNNEARIHDDAMAMVRFFHQRNAVGIHFVGDKMIGFANEHLPIILDSVEQALGRVRVVVQEANIALTVNGYPSSWVIPTMALKNPNFDFLSKEQYCERIIKQDILRQAHILGLDIPSEFYLKVTRIEDDSDHWVRAGAVRNGKTGGARRLKGVEFISNLNFQGSWAAGSLLSKGFGVIVRPRLSVAEHGKTNGGQSE